VAIRWRDVRVPHLALLLGLIPVVAFWDPARQPPLGRALVGVASVGLWGVVTFVRRRSLR
jgi:hypothetical protein